MAESSSSPSSSFRAGRAVLLALAAVLLAAYFFTPASSVLDVTLDASNYGSYSLFTAQERQYGTEVVPMAGPYGFVLYGFTYAGKLYGTRFILELLTKLTFAALVLWLFGAVRSPVARWIWLFVLLLQLQGATELAYDFTILFAGLYVLLNYRRPGGLIACGAATVALAFLALGKGTQLVFTVAVFGLAGLQAFALRDFRRFGLLAATFVVALLAFWLAAGQNPLHFPGFVHGINQLSSGYNAAMGMQEPPLAFATGAGALGCLYLALFAVAWPRRRALSVALAAVMIAGFSFLKWKHGFVRADGHVYIFYQYAILAALTAWMIGRLNPTAPVARGWDILAGVSTAACIALAVWGPGDHSLARLKWQGQIAWAQLPANARALLAPQAAKRELESRLAVNRAVFALPDVVRTVGRGSIDFFGFEHGYLPLNRLNYRPRPMGGGSFNVFTPYLQELNARHVADPATRPDYFLLKLQTIDNRLLAQDDASTLRTILAGYAPVLAEQGLLLLQAQPGAAVPAEPRPLLTRTFKFGETVGLPKVGPGEMLLVQFELPETLRGKIRSALYKPGALYLSLSGDGLAEPESRRLLPSLVTRPVIVSPALENTADLLGLYSSEPGKTVRDFRLTAQLPECFDESRLRVTAFAAPRPAPIDPAQRQLLAQPLRYPISNRLPAQIDPANSVLRAFAGLPVQMLEPPGKIVFDLTGRERGIEFNYGIDPEAYTRGTTDGVEFWVELVPPGAKGQELYRETLHPLTVPADRGTHHKRFTFPPLIRPGSQLILHTGPGSTGNGGWDWSYYTGIHLDYGPFVLEQFPGFNVPPVEIAADYLGAMTDSDGREIFMLNAPGRLTFDVTPATRRLRFTGGLMRGAYTQGQTDGAEYIVELHATDGTTRPLLRRWLRPLTVETDRGDQGFDVTLPPYEPGQRVTLRTDVGPYGSNAWDWTYIFGLTFGPP